MDASMGDEEIARALQAIDNGLRKRKRSISMEEVKKPRSRPKGDTPLRKGKTAADAASSPQSASSPPSAASPASTDNHEGVAEVPKLSDNTASFNDSDTFCLACGKLFSASESQHADMVTPSKENHLICGACFVHYALTPYKAHAVVKASPSHRCEGHGCAVTFITAERLKDHYHRVHGVSSRAS